MTSMGMSRQSLTSEVPLTTPSGPFRIAEFCIVSEVVILKGESQPWVLDRQWPKNVSRWLKWILVGLPQQVQNTISRLESLLSSFLCWSPCCFLSVGIEIAYGFPSLSCSKFTKSSCPQVGSWQTRTEGQTHWPGARADARRTEIARCRSLSVVHNIFTNGRRQGGTGGWPQSDKQRIAFSGVNSWEAESWLCQALGTLLRRVLMFT